MFLSVIVIFFIFIFYNYGGFLKEENKRRFIEEKFDDKVLENLFGYEVCFKNLDCWMGLFKYMYLEFFFII